MPSLLESLAAGIITKEQVGALYDADLIDHATWANAVLHPTTARGANAKREAVAAMVKQITDEAFAAVAQGVINIESELTTIEKSSRVHRGMSALCELRSLGLL